MTKCSRNEHSSRKSTVYNQTGESYFGQLCAYNSMCTHLRRLLLAKSVVDTRNKSYPVRNNQHQLLSKRNEDKSRFHKRESSSHSTVNRSSYDRLTCRRPTGQKNSAVTRDPSWKCCFECYNNSSQLQALTGYIGFGENTQSSPSHASSSSTEKHVYRPASAPRTKHRSPLLEINIRASSSGCIEGNNISKQGHTSFDPRLDDETSPSVSNTGILTPKKDNHISVRSTGGTKFCDFESNKGPEKISAAVCAKNEREKYAQFAYDITQDILENGLYTDADLQEVFKKHILRNEGRLDMQKMLLEIYQLKASLSMFDNSELDKELEDFVKNRKFMNSPEIRTHTSTKKDRVTEKLMPREALPDTRPKSFNVTKSVVLSDANPELLLTERDVLLSLMEAHIEPGVAERICRSLHCRSRSASIVNSLRSVDGAITESREETQQPFSD